VKADASVYVHARNGLRTGDAEKVLANCEALLASRPQMVAVRATMLLAKLRLGRGGGVVDELELLARKYPLDHSVLACLGEALRLADRPEAARTSAAETLERLPDCGPLWCVHGEALLACGTPGPALESFDRSLARDRRDRDAQLGRATALAALGRSTDAEREYRRVLQAEAAEPGASAGVARLCIERGAYDLAERLLDAALLRHGDSALLSLRRARLEECAGRWETAREWLERAGAANLARVDDLRELTDALLNAGCVPEAERVLRFAAGRSAEPIYTTELAELLWCEGRELEAIALMREALRRCGQSAPLLIAIARILLERLPQHGGQVLERLVQARPDHPKALSMLGEFKLLQGRIGEMLQFYERALAHAPDNLALRIDALWPRMLLIDWSRWNEDAPLVDSAPLGTDGAGEGHLRIALMIGNSAARQRELAEDYARSVRRLPPAPARARSRPARLRIGYLSPDFRDHPVARVVAGVLRHHDRRQFHVTALSTLRQVGDEQQAIRDAVDEFVDLQSLRDGAIVHEIRRREIDVLVDLAGHTFGARTAALTARPAPVQVNWLGFPGTMGGTWIDYIIADDYVIPPGAEKHYVEQVVRLPGTFFPQDRSTPPPDPPSRRHYGLPEDAVVIASFNRALKLTPPLFDALASAIRDLPQAVLWLSLPPESQVGLGRELAARGVGPERIIFAGREPSHDAHLARYRHASLALDTFPYNSHTTASDALWMGCPLITVSGETFASRVAGSLLRAVGLPELATPSLSAWSALLAELVRDPARLAGLRRHLETVGRESRLFDTRGFVTCLESAYFAMFDRWLAGMPPAAIQVDDRCPTGACGVSA
jgi:predicted O-linked N-acetylglucosamine transferase (SPINDLY family)/Flp pilus assembly protein TadD